MPRPWTEYGARDWARLRPLVERYHHELYRAVDAAALARPALAGDVEALRQAIAGRRVLAAIAFNDPAYVEAQARLVRRNVPDAVHVIADNSTDDVAAAAIAEIAARERCGHLRLPRSPWRKPEHAGRSHGLALTWVWRHLVSPARPEAFGFIDHDIFPMRPTDPFARLREHAVAGRVVDKSGRGRWHLWAGFCFFRFEAVERLALDFSTDWGAGLDTGGGNWRRLYARLSPAQVFETDIVTESLDPGVSAESLRPGVPAASARFEWIGDWLHAGAFSTTLAMDPAARQALLGRKRAILDARLAAALGSEQGL